MAERIICPHCEAATRAHPGNLHLEAGVSLTCEPFVHLAWRKERQQMTPQDARDFAANLVQISLVAEYEAAFTRWCRDKMDVDARQAGLMLAEMRDYFVEAEEMTGGRMPRQSS